jgi:hypothetical protein
MEQQIQINQPPERVLDQAASFFAKRRARVSDRTDRGFRFGLQGGAGQDSGRVTVAPSGGGTSTVTVQADGLGVMAIAESFVRELRKQARDQGRTAQRSQLAGGGTTMRGDFSGLRERLGMPPVERPPRREPAAARPPRAASGEARPEASPEASEASSAETASEVSHEPEGLTVTTTTPASPEATGGVPAAGDIQAGAPSETAKAHSGAGAPDARPVLDPSVPPAQG